MQSHDSSGWVRRTAMLHSVLVHRRGRQSDSQGRQGDELKVARASTGSVR
jgi:hypothetical protein